MSFFGAFDWRASSNNQFTWAPNCAYTSGTFQWLSLTSTDACGNACAANSKCSHFIYHSGMRICDLMTPGSNPNNPVSDSIRTCGWNNAINCNISTLKKSILLTWVYWQFFWSSNCNYPANDISSQTLNSITDCGNATSWGINFFLRRRRLQNVFQNVKKEKKKS